MEVSEISIIVPIYHGKKYIENIIRQIQACAGHGEGKYTLELLFINDDPNESLDSNYLVSDSRNVKIKAIETDRNRGIHGARVRGLAYCTGDFVLFLDQDDRIREEYFSSQLVHLGQADAVVCKLLHEGKQFYDTRMPFEQVITREYMISVRNPIISPGQVLIRKDKIPESWKETELQNNGADDWLLWLCMLAEYRVFALNDDILFEHIVAGENESFNVEHMIASEQELYRVIADQGIFTEHELHALGEAIDNAAKDHIKVLHKFQKMFFVYNTWMSLQEQGICIEDYLKQNNFHNIAIYGCSYIGKRLYHSLDKTDICVDYFIDMNADYLEWESKIYRPDVQLPPVDLIIICLVDGVAAIAGNLSRVFGARICGIAELLDEMKDWEA